MRADVFLKRSRLVKRRSSAKELCDEGAVTLGDRPVRAGKDVRVGDRLKLRFWNRLLEIEIESLPSKTLSAVESRGAYRVLSEERIEG